MLERVLLWNGLLLERLLNQALIYVAFPLF